MKKILHPEKTRGTAELGWLQARYSFSFANYFNPERTQFGALRVLNDDTISAGMGFGKHSHKNMEIVTIPLSGALKHRDSLNNEGIVQSDEIQVMSAGTGIEHSEANANKDKTLKLLQIWVFPEKENVNPRYDQKNIRPQLKSNTLNKLVSPKEEAGKDELWLNQQTYFNLGEFSKETSLTYKLNNKNHGAYIFVIKGMVFFDNEALATRDAIGIWETDEVSLKIEKDSTVLLIEVPMNV